MIFAVCSSVNAGQATTGLFGL